MRGLILILFVVEALTVREALFKIIYLLLPVAGETCKQSEIRGILCLPVGGV